MKQLTKQLKTFTPKEYQRYIEITFPIVTHLNGGFLRVRIKNSGDGYALYCPDNLFFDANGSQKFYFDIFKKYGQSVDFGVSVKKEKFYKAFGKEDSVVVIIDQFVRLILNLENFIFANDVIGHEENFPL